MGLSGGKNLGRGIEFKRRKNYPIKMAARPMVTVFGDQGEATEQMALPTVFCAPIRIWRRWHRHVNQNQRRYATVSGIAATALPALVMARGHKIENIPEVPLVVSGMESLTKTKAAVALLKRLSAYDDVQKCIDSKKIRAGKGKLRNRRHRM